MSERGYGLYYESFDNIIGEEVFGKEFEVFCGKGLWKK